MRLSPWHRTRVPALCLASICLTSVGLASLSTHFQFVKATAASIASGRPNYFASTAPSAKSLTPAPPFGNTITVNSTADVAISNDGLCTLREAIIAADTKATKLVVDPASKL